MNHDPFQSGEGNRKHTRSSANANIGWAQHVSREGSQHWYADGQYVPNTETRSSADADIACGTACQQGFITAMVSGRAIRRHTKQSAARIQSLNE